MPIETLASELMDIAPILTPVIMATTATAAFLAIWRNQVIARRRATIDLVIAQRSDETLQTSKRKLAELHDDQQDCLAKYAANEHREGEESKAILAVLNHYEFVATGIKEGAFDERVYKKMLHGVLVRDYDALKGFIQELRRTRSHKTLFQEYEWLGKKWKAKPLKPNTKDQ